MKRKCELALGTHINIETAIYLFTLASLIDSPALQSISAKFILKNITQLVETNQWHEMVKTNPTLMNEIFKNL